MQAPTLHVVVGHREDGTELAVDVPKHVLDKARSASRALAGSKLFRAAAVAAAKSVEPGNRILVGSRESPKTHEKPPPLAAMNWPLAKNARPACWSPKARGVVQ